MADGYILLMILGNNRIPSVLFDKPLKIPIRRREFPSVLCPSMNFISSQVKKSSIREPSEYQTGFRFSVPWAIQCQRVLMPFFSGVTWMHNKYYVLVCLVFWLGPTLATAGVVVTSTLNTISNGQGKVVGSGTTSRNGAGVVFTTGSTSSWKLNSIQLSFSSSGGTYGSGSIAFFLYKMASGANPKTANSLTYVGDTTLSINGINGNMATPTFSLANLANSSVPVTLDANTQYFLGLNVYESGGTFLRLNGADTPTASNGWSIASGYSYMVANGGSAPTTINDFSSSTSSVGYSYVTGGGLAGFGFIMDATAVPEPATIVLFGTAIAIGGVGVYMKRRKQKPALV
jgi:hypothetical protein